MSMLNSAHVEAICSARYLENYLDCMESLPDELQRILSQIREIDARLVEHEKECYSYEAVLQELTPEEPLDTKSVAALEKVLLRIQEFEDEKIQLSSALHEYIENRSRTLEQDSENLDPTSHSVERSSPAPLKTTSRRESSKNSDKNRQSVGENVNKSTVAAPNKRRRAASNKNTETMSTPVPIKQIKTEPVSKKQEESDALPVNKRTAAVNEDKTCSGSSTISKANAGSNNNKRGSNNKKKNNNKKKEDKKDDIDPDEPTYCLCEQISYGEMVGCDNDNCPIEWFHFNCVNLAKQPKGKWFCPQCRGDKSNVMRKTDKR